ncbi:MAG: hypothetical protein M1361_00580 [Patescibacteria group bacterium]|nr:hypothetical protein [Patescibacteria group bacterium]MCL5224107.1 hypothetical protein [Patescibacteria group bacterium]
MIVFLSGPDSYLRSAKEREIVEIYRKKHGSMSDDRFDFGDNSEIENLEEFLANNSMFEVSKLAVVESPFKASATKLAKILKGHLKDDPNTTILVVSDSDPPAAMKFLKEKPSMYQEFPTLTGKALDLFIQKEASRRGLKLGLAVVNEIAKAFEGDSWSIVTELDKLGLMNRKVLDFEKPAPEYFELINVLKYDRDMRHKLTALEIMLSDRKDDPARIFNTLAYRLCDRKEAEVFADYDVSIKSGRLDYEEVLVDLALHS